MLARAECIDRELEERNVRTISGVKLTARKSAVTN